jgi:magnesium transporter
VLDHIRAVEHTRETVYAIYLVDPLTDALLRAITLRQLIFADTGATVLSVAPARAPMSVTPETPEAETVRLISKYNLLTIPVVDTGQHVIEIVTVDDAVDTLVAQQDAEVQNFGGMEALDAPYHRESRLARSWDSWARFGSRSGRTSDSSITDRIGSS